MNLIVCVKQTFDTEEKIVIDGLRVSEENVQFVMNPYDEYAVEEALRLRDQFGGEVTVVTVGPERAEQVLRTALAMGADRAIHVVHEEAFPDEAVLSAMLAKVIDPLPYDMILAGNFSVDNGSGQVAIRLAELLDLPHIGSVTALRVEGSEVAAVRDAEGGSEEIRAALPVLITAQQGLNEPRYPSMAGIIKARKKTVERLTAADLGMGEAPAPKTLVTALSLPPKKAAGIMLEGSVEKQVRQLSDLLRNEAKVV